MPTTKNISVESDDVEKLEEEILAAADKAGKGNVIVNIFSLPGSQLKKRWLVRYKFNKKHLVIDALIGVAILFLVGLNVFWWYGGFNYFYNSLSVNITANTKDFTIGAPVTFSIEYQNNNKFMLRDVVLSLNQPQNFSLSAVSNKDFDVKTNTLKIGELAAGANGKLEVNGSVYGNLGDEQKLSVNLNYFKTDTKGGTLWGQFQKAEIFTYNLNKSYLEVVSTDMNDKVVAGQMYGWQVKLRNSSPSLPFAKLIFRPTYDNEFIAFDEKEIVVQNLLPGAEATININAKLKTELDKKKIGFIVEAVDTTTSYKQIDWQKELFVFQPKFEVTREVTSGARVNPGEYVDFVLRYKNAGQYSLADVKLSMGFKGDYWDLNNIKKETGRREGDRNLSWTFEDIPRFALIQPGEAGEIKFSVKTREYVPNSTDLALQSRVEMNFTVDNQAVAILGEYISTKLNSNLSVSAFPMYYTKAGDQLGRGPIPPRVGEETKYWIFAKMVNDIDPVKDVTVTATLPGNVSWNDRTSVPVGNAILYSAETRTLTWQISEVPVGPTNIGFAFEVGIVPGASQSGTYPVLLTNIKVSGTDSTSGEKIEKSLGSITTKLVNDPRGKLRDGVVK